MFGRNRNANLDTTQNCSENVFDKKYVNQQAKTSADIHTLDTVEGDERMERQKNSDREKIIYKKKIINKQKMMCTEKNNNFEDISSFSNNDLGNYSRLKKSREISKPLRNGENDCRRGLQESRGISKTVGNKDPDNYRELRDTVKHVRKKSGRHSSRRENNDLSVKELQVLNKFVELHKLRKQNQITGSLHRTRERNSKSIINAPPTNTEIRNKERSSYSDRVRKCFRKNHNYREIIDSLESKSDRREIEKFVKLMKLCKSKRREKFVREHDDEVWICLANPKSDLEPYCDAGVSVNGNKRKNSLRREELVFIKKNKRKWHKIGNNAKHNKFEHFQQNNPKLKRNNREHTVRYLANERLLEARLRNKHQEIKKELMQLSSDEESPKVKTKNTWPKVLRRKTKHCEGKVSVKNPQDHKPTLKHKSHLTEENLRTKFKNNQGHRRKNENLDENSALSSEQNNLQKDYDIEDKSLRTKSQCRNQCRRENHQRPQQIAQVKVNKERQNSFRNSKCGKTKSGSQSDLSRSRTDEFKHAKTKYKAETSNPNSAYLLPVNSLDSGHRHPVKEIQTSGKGAYSADYSKKGRTSSIANDSQIESDQDTNYSFTPKSAKDLKVQKAEKKNQKMKEQKMLMLEKKKQENEWKKIKEDQDKKKKLPGAFTMFAKLTKDQEDYNDGLDEDLLDQLSESDNMEEENNRHPSPHRSRSSVEWQPPKRSPSKRGSEWQSKRVSSWQNKPRTSEQFGETSENFVDSSEPESHGHKKRRRTAGGGLAPQGSESKASQTDNTDKKQSIWKLCPFCRFVIDLE